MSQKKKILIVDDEDIILEPIGLLLQESGYECCSARNGKEAIHALSSSLPDLILLDLAMPEMDGITFLRHMATARKRLPCPVVVFSGGSNSKQVLEAIHLGASDYLLKARFSTTELIRRIERSIGAFRRTVAVETATAQTIDEPPSKSDEATSDSAPSVHSPEITTHADLVPLIDKTQVEQILDRTSRLRGFSPVVAQVMELTENPHCAVDVLADSIRQDPAISLRVLKLANSVLYYRGEKVQSIAGAISRIGVTEVRQIVMNLGVIDQYSESVDSGAFAVEILPFWEHSIACGLISSRLMHAMGCDKETTDTAFTIGLLHDAAKLIYSRELSDIYTQVMESTRRRGQPLEQAEFQLMGMSHASAMKRILEIWRFPREMILPITSHHSSLQKIQAMDERTRLFATTLCLADRLSQTLLLGDSGNPYLRRIDDWRGALGVRHEVIEEMSRSVPGELEDIKLFMLSFSSSSPWPSARKKWQQQLAGAFRPVALPRYSTVEVLCARLQVPAKDSNPNIALIELADASQIATILDSLRQVESAHGLDPLPVILLSEIPRDQIPRDLFQGRQIQWCPMPARMDFLIQSINEMLGYPTNGPEETPMN